MPRYRSACGIAAPRPVWASRLRDSRWWRCWRRARAMRRASPRSASGWPACRIIAPCDTGRSPAATGANWCCRRTCAPAPTHRTFPSIRRPTICPPGRTRFVHQRENSPADDVVYEISVTEHDATRLAVRDANATPATRIGFTIIPVGATNFAITSSKGGAGIPGRISKSCRLPRTGRAFLRQSAPRQCRCGNSR